MRYLANANRLIDLVAESSIGIPCNCALRDIDRAQHNIANR